MICMIIAIVHFWRVLLGKSVTPVEVATWEPIVRWPEHPETDMGSTTMHFEAEREAVASDFTLKPNDGIWSGNGSQ